MIASSLITPIAQMNPDWARSNILNVINDLVQAVLQRETDANVYIDPTTGDLPYLATTGGTFQYSISVPGVSFFKIQEIVTGNTPPIFDAKNNTPSVSREVFFMGRKYYVAQTKKTQPLGNQPASVIFRADPTTQPTQYQIYGYVSPVAAALSESTQIPIEEQYRQDMVGYVQELVDAMDNGLYATVLPTIQMKFLNKITYSTDVDVNQSFCKNYSY